MTDKPYSEWTAQELASGLDTYIQTLTARAESAEARLKQAVEVMIPFAECEIDELCPDRRPLVSHLLPPGTHPNYGDVRAARQFIKGQTDAE